MENDYTNKFSKFGGEKIENIVNYLRNFIIKQPGITITVGCDSTQKRKRTIYSITIMIYNSDVKNGAHIVYFMESLPKIRFNQERLDKESHYAFNVSEFLDKELSKFYKRKDLDDNQLRLYKYHLKRCDGDCLDISLNNIDSYINNIYLNENDRKTTYKLVDIHLDYNPNAGIKDNKGIPKNRSNTSYRTQVPWLRSIGYRVFCKNVAYAASSAADLLLKD